jgi:hypothetical protein
MFSKVATPPNGEDAIVGPPGCTTPVVQAKSKGKSAPPNPLEKAAINELGIYPPFLSEISLWTINFESGNFLKHIDFCFV